MWQGVNFWLNCNCISTSDSNGIAKVCEGLCIDICMTTLKLRLNSKEAFELSNEINKMAKFFKKNNFSVEEMYRQEMDDLELKIASKCILHLRVD